MHISLYMCVSTYVSMCVNRIGKHAIINSSKQSRTRTYKQKAHTSPHANTHTHHLLLSVEALAAGEARRPGAARTRIDAPPQQTGRRGRPGRLPITRGKHGLRGKGDGLRNIIPFNGNFGRLGGRCVETQNIAIKGLID